MRVVAGLFWRNACVLVQQRPAHKALPLLWEFPGGKVESGETDAAALTRECQEELGVAVQVGALAWEVQHTYTDTRVWLRIYHAQMPADATPQPYAAATLMWCPPQDLAKLTFCPADVPLVEAMRAGHVRSTF